MSEEALIQKDILALLCMIQCSPEYLGVSHNVGMETYWGLPASASIHVLRDDPAISNASLIDRPQCLRLPWFVLCDEES